MKTLEDKLADLADKYHDQIILFHIASIIFILIGLQFCEVVTGYIAFIFILPTTTTLGIIQSHGIARKERIKKGKI